MGSLALKMRIAFITSTPLNVERGSGTFVGIQALARALRNLGVEIDIIAPKFSFPIYTVQRLLFNLGLRFKRPPDCDAIIGFDMDGFTLRHDTRTLHMASIKGVIADELRFESGLTRLTMRVQALCEKIHVRRANKVITTSLYAARRIRELYGVPEPRVVPELIDLAAWEALMRDNRARYSPGKFVVLSVCRFYPRKRLDILLEATARLSTSISTLEVRIVGGGPEMRRLKAICCRKKLQDVIVWREDIPQNELAQEYNRCDVFCLPSVQEGFGIVFLEAMATGKPIIAARAAAVPEVASHAILVEPDNPQALADAIESTYKDPALRESIANAGRLLAPKYDASLVARLFLAEIAK
jgi:glycosyltransferase involved in cell wall biosynthesis